jgi:hypothetical protein
MPEFDKPTFSMMRWMFPTERGLEKALKDGDFLRRLIPDEQPKELPKGRNARRRAYKRAKRQASNTN